MQTNIPIVDDMMERFAKDEGALGVIGTVLIVLLVLLVLGFIAFN